MGAAPLSPPHPDFVTAMGRTNDAIIYGGRVQLFVAGPAAEAKTSRRGAAQSRVARFRRSVRRDFQALQGRFLRHRSDAVLSGRGHRHRDRKRREFSRRRRASQIARCLVRLTRRRAAPTRPTILVVSDQRDWHARQMEAAFAAAGARVERIDLAECGFDTQERERTGVAGPGIATARRRARPHAVGRLVRGDHQTPGRPARVERTRRRRLERRARHRTLRRQVDDELPARPRRRADAADLDDGIGRSRARPCRTRSAARSARAQAAVRRAGEGLAPHSPTRTTCPARKPSRGSIISSDFNRTEPRISRTIGCSSCAVAWSPR